MADWTVERLERKMRSSGLSNRELKALKEARKAARDEKPGSIRHTMNERARRREMADLRRDAELRQRDYLENLRRFGLIGQDSVGLGGRAGGGRGAAAAESDPAPEQFRWRDIKPGEEYDPMTDIMFDGKAIRRREVTPEWQAWSVRQAQGNQQAQAAPKPPPANVLTAYADLLARRRDSQDPAEQAAIDEQIAMYQNAHPGLGSGGGQLIGHNPTGGAGGGADVTVGQFQQAAAAVGMPKHAQDQILGYPLQGQGSPSPSPAPAPAPESVVPQGYDPSEIVVEVAPPPMTSGSPVLIGADMLKRAGQYIGDLMPWSR